MNDNFIIHYGVLGMKWGIRKNRFINPHEFQKYLSSNIKYSNFTKLKSPEEVLNSRKGSCHDQVMLEIEELKKLKLNPKSYFVMEYDPKTKQGGTTHSFVTYKNRDNKINWLENAWGGREGIHKYNSINNIISDIKRSHEKGDFGSGPQYSKLIFTEFGNHKPGESLQELVDIALRQKRVF